MEGSNEFGGEEEDVARVEGFVRLGKGEWYGREAMGWVREEIRDDELEDGVARGGDEHGGELSEHSDC